MSRIDRVSQIASRLEQQILSGELVPGTQIPSEREISAQLKVSRSVVREALGRLASLGLIQSVHGSGTRVGTPTTKQVTMGYRRLLSRDDVKLEDVWAVRMPLETAIAALAAQNREEEHLVRLEKAQKVLGSARRSLEAHAKADLEFHSILAEASGNPVFAVVLAPIQELLIASRRRTLGRYGSQLAHEHHAKILQAVTDRDPDRAAREMRAHLTANLMHLKQEAENEEKFATE
jgi:GntR family transcriptional repressor for pyruvate dehydrogenase complex